MSLPDVSSNDSLESGQHRFIPSRVFKYISCSLNKFILHFEQAVVEVPEVHLKASVLAEIKQRKVPVSHIRR